MGFRHPITTATAVDTGQGLGDAGVRIYQDLSYAAAPRGVAEWRTGTMGKNATIALSGGGSNGSAFEINGGTSAGTTGPYIDLNVESLAAGGYGPKARISQPWEAVASCVPVVGPGPNQGGGVLGPGLINYDTTSWGPLTFWQLADGRVGFQGMLRNVLGSSIVSGAALVVANTLPAWARPLHAVPPIICRCSTIAPAPGHARVDVTPTGLVQLLETTIPNNEWISLVGSYRTDI